jgi:hypothetical protein
MAYALKVETCEQRKDGKEGKESKDSKGEGAWFGFTPAVVPFKAVPTEDKEKAAAAKKHLDKAIAVYKALVEDQPTHLPAQLGLAWCLEQAGDKKGAIEG